MTELSDRLAAAKGNDSIDAIVERATRAGHPIDRATIGRYVAGDGAKRPPERTLQALAAGLRLDVRELRRLASAPVGELEAWQPPAVSARLSRDQRDALDALIKAIVAGDRSSDAGSTAPTIRAEVSSAPLRTVPSAPGQVAARDESGESLADEARTNQDQRADEEGKG